MIVDKILYVYCPLHGEITPIHMFYCDTNDYFYFNGCDGLQNQEACRFCANVCTNTVNGNHAILDTNNKTNPIWMKF